MRKKSEIEMEKARIAKSYRAITRLRNSLRADKEINDNLPDILEEFDKSIQSGELKQLYTGLEALFELD